MLDSKRKLNIEETMGQFNNLLQRFEDEFRTQQAINPTPSTNSSEVLEYDPSRSVQPPSRERPRIVFKNGALDLA